MDSREGKRIWVPSHLQHLRGCYQDLVLGGLDQELSRAMFIDHLSPTQLGRHNASLAAAHYPKGKGRTSVYSSREEAVSEGPRNLGSRTTSRFSALILE